MAARKKGSTNALNILHKRYFEGKSNMLELLEAERENAKIARTICDLRTNAGLSQRELAARVGTSASAICRLEDADYEGHSLSMLQRIAAALNQKVEVNFVPVKTRRTARKRSGTTTKRRAKTKVA
jgi:ribosome-binding protein aMBF1 (putative translation factor)